MAKLRVLENFRWNFRSCKWLHDEAVGYFLVDFLQLSVITWRSLYFLVDFLKLSVITWWSLRDISRLSFWSCLWLHDEACGILLGRLSEAVCDYTMKPVGYFLVDCLWLHDESCGIFLGRLPEAVWLDDEAGRGLFPKKKIIFTDFYFAALLSTLLLLEFSNKLSSNNPKAKPV